MDFAWRRLGLAVLAVAATFLPRVASADEEFPPPPPPLPPDDGAVYLILSAPESEFSLGNFDNVPSSGTILVRIGTYTGGGGVLDSRFVLENVPPFAFPTGVTLADLDGNQATIVGAFQVPPPPGGALPQPHIVTPTEPRLPNPDEDDAGFVISPEVQAAIFQATHDGRLGALGTNPTVADICASIVGSSETISTSDVFQAVFTTPMTVGAAFGVLSTEGDVFPHTPSGALFHFEASLEENDDGDVVTTVDGCRLVAIDVDPNHDPNLVHWKSKKGNIKVAFLSSEGFDP